MLCLSGDHYSSQMPTMTAPAPTFAAWTFCSARTCEQEFTGLVKVRLAIALWAKYAHLTDMGEGRLFAVGTRLESTEAIRLASWALALVGCGPDTPRRCAPP